MLSAFSALTPLVGHQEEHLARKKIECWGTGMVICLECGANDLHMVQLMPLPPIISCFSKILSGAGLPRLSWKKRPLNVCVCIYTVSQKKLGHFYFYCNFGKCWSILKILLLLESEGSS